MFPKLCPHFRRFLIERGLFFQFHLNMLLFWLCDWKGYAKARRSLATCKSYALNVAFDWESSLEGPDFWDSIDRKWNIQYRFLLSGGIIKEYTLLDDDTRCNK